MAEQEIFSLEELVEAFDIAGISKSPAIFDIEKLTHFNAALPPRHGAGGLCHGWRSPISVRAVKNPAIDAAGDRRPAPGPV